MQRTVSLPWVYLGATLIVGTACASGANRAARGGESCALRAADSAYVLGGPVYRDCAVDTKARLVNSRDIRPSFTPDQRTACYSVRLEFVVGTDGAPELGSVRTVSATSGVYARAVMETLPHWKYEPARIEGRSVRQIVSEERKMGVSMVVVPAGSGRPSPGSVRDPC